MSSYCVLRWLMGDAFTPEFISYGPFDSLEATIDFTQNSGLSREAYIKIVPLHSPDEVGKERTNETKNV